MNAWYAIAIGSGTLMTILILLQTRGAGLGAGLGGGGEVHTVRRGSERTIFQLTIITAAIFSFCLLAGTVSA